ncbi:MAG TPA: DUF2188 domain-containing protein [Verrucomicrobiae bacterium]|nr:DUF2188 domain-containing protein [Verrucomicrobiae bacterium]
MAAKKETFYVSQSDQGWMVRTDGGREQSGPFPHKEDAIASALVSAKGQKPSRVRVHHAVGNWSVECTYRE